LFSLSLSKAAQPFAKNPRQSASSVFEISLFLSRKPRSLSLKIRVNPRHPYSKSLFFSLESREAFRLICAIRKKMNDFYMPCNSCNSCNSCSKKIRVICAICGEKINPCQSASSVFNNNASVVKKSGSGNRQPPLPSQPTANSQQPTAV